jgi:GT2 family glycosyltransferase
MEENILYIHTEECRRPRMQESVLASRLEITGAHQTRITAEVTLAVVAYNRVDKTRRCVESILAHTQEIDYSLILIDNGSEDSTLEYFQSVCFEKKKIIRITKNIGGMMPFTYLDFQDIGEYMVFIANDLVLTDNWLRNLLICAKSDSRIGMVVPFASNCSNYQGVNLPFTTAEEMQEKASAFNQSDPKKWQERLRLITLAPLFRKETLFAIGFPLFDPAFFHDFADDDVTFRVRRMGYKAMLAGDTWIHHDHHLQIEGDKDMVELQKSLAAGRLIFREKWKGIDAWDDVNNFYLDILPYVTPVKVENPRMLGIDVRCGTPVLDVKNKLRTFGVENLEISAFTQDHKYAPDLETVSNGVVVCDRMGFIKEHFMQEQFDYIMIGNPMERYQEPEKVIAEVFSLAKKGGLIILSLMESLNRLYVEIIKQGELKFCHVRNGNSVQQEFVLGIEKK